MFSRRRTGCLQIHTARLAAVNCNARLVTALVGHIQDLFDAARNARDWFNLAPTAQRRSMSRMKLVANAMRLISISGGKSDHTIAGALPAQTVTAVTVFEILFSQVQARVQFVSIVTPRYEVRNESPTDMHKTAKLVAMVATASTTPMDRAH